MMVTSRPASALVLYTAAILALVFVGVGCSNSESPPPPDIRAPERVIACDRANGMYFDPLSAQCRKAETTAQAYMWGQYRRVNELALEAAEHEYRVVFTTYLSPSEVVQRLNDLSYGRVTNVTLLFSSVDGVNMSVPVTGQTMPTSDSLSAAILDALQHTPIHNEDLRQHLVTSYSAGEASVLNVSIRGPAKSIKLWLDEHLQEIRLIQALEGQLDRLQLDYCPDCTIP